MKALKLILALLCLSIFSLASCQSLSTEPVEVVSLSLEATPNEIILSEENSYQEEVFFSWSITNLSDETISSETHELDISTAVPNSYESTLITILDIELAPGETMSGEYSHLISGISVEGEFEFQLNLYEKGRQYMTEVARVSQPYSLYWGEL